MKREIITSIYDKLQGNKSFNNLGSLLRISKNFGWDLTVYEKIDGLDPNERISSDKSTADCNVIQIRNNGSCDYSFIRHIYDNYDNLSDLMVFTKVNLSDSIMLDGVHSKFFPFCDDYDFSDFGAFPIRAVWNLDLEYRNREYLEFSYQSVDGRNPEYGVASNWFDFIFKDYDKPKTTFSIWGHGPLFCVSKKIVMRHSREIYKYLLDSFDDEYHASRNGFVSDSKSYCPRHDIWQRFWRVLFTHGHERDGVFKIQQNPHYYIETSHEIKK